METNSIPWVCPDGVWTNSLLAETGQTWWQTGRPELKNWGSHVTCCLFCTDSKICETWKHGVIFRRRRGEMGIEWEWMKWEEVRSGGEMGWHWVRGGGKCCREGGGGRTFSHIHKERVFEFWRNSKMVAVFFMCRCARLQSNPHWR